MARFAWVLAICLVGCGGDDGPSGSPDTGPRADTGPGGGEDSGPAGDVDSGPGGAMDAGPGADAGPSTCTPDPMPPGTMMCPSECTGGCMAGVCTIDCTGDSACDGDAIVCPPEYACNVVCDGVDACDSGSITCPPGYACTVTCRGGNDACGDQQIDCGDATCAVDCADDTCDGAVVMCGDGPCSATCGAMPAPTTECGSSCGCTPC